MRRTFPSVSRSFGKLSNYVYATVVQLVSDNLEVLFAKNKFLTLTAANSFALSREPDISPATSFSSNVVRCRLCDSLTDVSGISHKEKTLTVSPTTSSTFASPLHPVYGLRLNKTRSFT
jgi:hypothetical protein